MRISIKVLITFAQILWEIAMLFKSCQEHCPPRARHALFTIQLRNITWLSVGGFALAWIGSTHFSWLLFGWWMYPKLDFELKILIKVGLGWQNSVYLSGFVWFVLLCLFDLVLGLEFDFGFNLCGLAWLGGSSQWWECVLGLEVCHTTWQGCSINCG